MIFSHKNSIQTFEHKFELNIRNFKDFEIKMQKIINIDCESFGCTLLIFAQC